MKTRKSTTDRDEKQSVRPRDLMLFLDGELDEAQHLEVERQLESDADARCHVTALRFTGSLLRERAEDSTAADSIADLVMARIEKRDLPAGDIDIDIDIAAAPPPVAELRNGAGRRALSSDPSEAARPAVAAREGAPRSLPHIGIPPSRRTANDNARTIWALTAVAVAAAAAFMIWGKAGDGPVADPTRPSTSQLPVDPTVELVGNPPPDLPTTPDTDVVGGVEVATIDFGSTHGSVFYVPGSGGETTTVVWLADDEPGGQQ
ncbi:MAG: hypothetical protein WKG00_12670 [Polyangiaceae bacterium]